MDDSDMFGKFPQYHFLRIILREILHNTFSVAFPASPYIYWLCNTCLLAIHKKSAKWEKYNKDFFEAFGGFVRRTESKSMPSEFFIFFDLSIWLPIKIWFRLCSFIQEQNKIYREIPNVSPVLIEVFKYILRGLSPGGAYIRGSL